MIIALIFFALLMILHYSLTILNINANALSLIFFIIVNICHICTYFTTVLHTTVGQLPKCLKTEGWNL